MAGFVLHVGATAICPHGGQMSVLPSGSRRVLLSGQPAATLADTYLIAGCAFTLPPGKPQPCITVKWIISATRVMVDGSPVLLKDSIGICQSAEQIPAGPPNIIMTQLHVKGT